MQINKAIYCGQQLQKLLYQQSNLIADQYISPIIIEQHDFTQINQLPDGFDLMRASTATYLENGNLVEVAEDIPRLNQQGLLIEPQRTNFYRNRNFSPSDFTKWAASDTVTVDGNIVTLTADVQQNRHGFFPIPMQNIPSTECFISLEHKNNKTSAYNYFYFLTTPTSSSVYIGDKISLPVASEFMRTTALIPTMNKTNSSLMLGAATNIGEEYSLSIRNAQLESGNYSTSLILMNSTAASTRAADHLLINLENYTGSIKTVIKRQDTGEIAVKWFDLINQDQLLLNAESLGVGCHLKNIIKYDRILNNDEKAMA